MGSISTQNCNSRNGTFSYGIDISAEERGNGYATEAIQLVLKYYFEELRYQKVTLPIVSDNHASIHLHEKLGFQQEGRFRRMLYSSGKYIDVLWYGMTMEEYSEII